MHPSPPLGAHAEEKKEFGIPRRLLAAGYRISLGIGVPVSARLACRGRRSGRQDCARKGGSSSTARQGCQFGCLARLAFPTVPGVAPTCWRFGEGYEAWETEGLLMPAIIEVHAKQGKRLRAEPIAQLYAQGLVHHLGEFPRLEGQLGTWIPGLPRPYGRCRPRSHRTRRPRSDPYGDAQLPGQSAGGTQMKGMGTCETKSHETCERDA